METLIRDVRYALRNLRLSPGFTAVAVLTLALGIGVNSTIFSLVSAVLLRPLPVEAPDGLVTVYRMASNGSGGHDSMSWPNVADLRDQSTTLDGIAAYTNFFANMAVGGRSELVIGEIVSQHYFDVLGVTPQLGRGFLAEEFVTEGTHPVAVLSYPFWSARFARDPGIVGGTVRLNGLEYTVVGVAPEGFGGMFPAVSSQMWVPVTMIEQVEPMGNQSWTGGPGETMLQQRGRHFLWTVGRRADGVSVEQVQAELGGIMARLASEYPESTAHNTVRVLPTNDVHLNPDIDGYLSPAGALMLGVVGLVLLVACANLANMLLARAAARQREIAVRLAIGAPRGRLVRQLLTESLTLALLGGGAGFVLATWISGLIARYQPPLPVQITFDIAPDWRVLAFTLAIASGTGVVFGLLPALRASRPDLVPALKDAGGADNEGRRRLHLRDVLVVVQVAVSIVLLVAGALMIRSLWAGQRVDLGYDPDHLAFLALPMEMNGYASDQNRAFYDAVSERLLAVPGVESLGNTTRVPLSLNDNNFGVLLEGHQTSRADRPYLTPGAYVDPGYFDAYASKLIDGRLLQPSDELEGRRVAVVTRAFAELYWPDRSAVGAQFRTRWDGEPTTIVGVIENYKVNSPGEPPTPYLHYPMRPDAEFANFMVRTSQPAAALLPQLERAVREVDPEFVFLDTGTARSLAATKLFPIQLGATLIGAFGVLALMLAAIGLYGVIGYSVSRRTREIGIRMALGAERSSVLTLVLRQGMVLVGIGALVGLLLATLTARLLSSVLFVSAIDPVSFGAAALVLAIIAAVANLLPARRAARVDPMIALRSQ